MKTAARGAALNVDTNLADVKDADYVSRVTREDAISNRQSRLYFRPDPRGSPSETASTRNVNFTGYG